MPVRATKRGAERTPLSGNWDVLVCGASFAGLAVARELRGHGARVLVVDRYEIGERQTSACAAPTELLRAHGPRGVDPADVRRAWSSTRRGVPRRWRAARSPSPPSTTGSCAGCCGSSAGDADVRDGQGRAAATGFTVHTDRGDLTAPLIVDALGWRRVLSAPSRDPAARRDALARAGGPPARQRATTSSCGWTPATSRPATRGRSRRATRCASASASFDPRVHVSSSRRSTSSPTSAARRTATRATGSRTGCAAPTEDGVFFVGDSAGHCLPTTAEGIRPALYFGVVLRPRAARGRRGPPGRARALRRYTPTPAAHRARSSPVPRPAVDPASCTGR